MTIAEVVAELSRPLDYAHLKAAVLRPWVNQMGAAILDAAENKDPAWFGEHAGDRWLNVVPETIATNFVGRSRAETLLWICAVVEVFALEAGLDLDGEHSSASHFVSATYREAINLVRDHAKTALSLAA